MLSGKLSVAHITEAFAGGLATYMTLVLPSLAAKGCDATLFCCNGRTEPSFADAMRILHNHGVKVRILPMQRSVHPWADARATIGLYREINSGTFDIVHTHGTKAGLIGRVAARLAGVPVVHTPHCYAFLRAQTRLSALLIRTVEQALRGSLSGLIAVCESERREAVKYGLVDRGRCVVVSNGMPADGEASKNTEQLRSELGLPHGSVVVTMAARLVAYKGIELFLDAAELCREMNVVFLLAGYGDMERWVRDQVNYRGISDYFRVLGHVKKIPELLGASDICVLCSKAEGQPYVLLEAMRCGCPIVATLAPGMQDLLEDGRTAILVRREAGELAHAIRKLGSDDALRCSLASEAKKEFMSFHLLDRQIDGLLAAYERFRCTAEAKTSACH